MHIYKKFTLVELMIVTGVIAIIVSIALPGLYRAKVSTQESSTIAALRAIVSTQSVFRSSLSCDQDNDGIGEFGLFIEITGEQPCRGPAATLIKGPMINKIFGITSTVNQGIASKSGYLYLMHLPTITGPALTEEDYFIMPLPTPRSDPLSADVQEIRFMCYSWPSVAGITGNKAFCVSHATEVFFTLNELGPGVWRYSGALPANRPVSGAALNGTNPAFAMNLEAFFIPLNPALDGLVWFPLSQ